MNDSFACIKTPITMMLLTEIISTLYPMKVCMREFVNGMDEPYVEVFHENRYAITKMIRDYINNNSPDR